MDFQFVQTKRGRCVAGFDCIALAVGALELVAAVVDLDALHAPAVLLLTCRRKVSRGCQSLTGSLQSSSAKAYPLSRTLSNVVLTIKADFMICLRPDGHLRLTLKVIPDNELNLQIRVR